ncbi:MAG: hypothetical protein OXF05_00065 [Hyphomicrobiales bacterium]|nr:hypothetical protein [Hyphomicrobiales bacterium]
MNAMVEAHWAVDASHVGWAVADMEGRLVAHAPWTFQSQETIRKTHAKEFFAARMAVSIAYHSGVRILHLYGDNDYMYSNREELDRQHPDMKVEVVMLREENNFSKKFNPADYWSKNFKLDGRLRMQDWDESMHNMLKEFKATNSMIRNHFAEERLIREKKAKSSFDEERVLKIRLDDLKISVRLSNCLMNENISTIGDLMKYSRRRLFTIQGFGRGCFSEVIQLLEEVGKEYDMVLSLGRRLIVRDKGDVGD